MIFIVETHAAPRAYPTVQNGFLTTVTSSEMRVEWFLEESARPSAIFIASMMCGLNDHEQYLSVVVS